MPTVGPRCGRCRKTEAACAYEYPCCKACSHFQAVLLETKPKPQPEPKPAKSSVQPIKQEPITSIEQLRLDETLIKWGYKWYVAHTGRAHLHFSSQALSACGQVRGTIGAPVAAWDTVCKKCLSNVAA